MKLILLLLFCTTAMAQKTKFTAAEVAEMKKLLLENELAEGFEAAGTNTYAEGEAPYEPKAMFDAFYERVTEHYVKGFVDKETYKYYTDEYVKLYLISINDPAYAVPVDADGDGVQDTDEEGNPLTQAPDPRVFWTERYTELFDTYFTRVQANPQSCVGLGANATTAACCNPYQKATYLGEKPNSCKKSGKTCTEQSDCCSGACIRKNLDEPGYCLTQKSCFAVNNVGDSCDAIDNYLCAGSVCLAQNSNTTGLNECKDIGAACSANNAIGDAECCSGKCSVNKKCVENYKCTNCVKSGRKPEAGQSCCPGYYLDSKSGKCRTNLIPLVPIIQSSIEWISEQIFPSAHADEKERNAAQQEYLERLIQQCRADYPTDPVGYEICYNESVAKAENDFDQDSEQDLSQEQIAVLEQMRVECTRDHQAGTQSHSDCMAAVNAQEEAYRQGNGGECQPGQGSNCEPPSEKDLIKQKKAPDVTAKTYSNIEKCEFYSYNDNWRDASPMEKNAELFLRAFEFTFSHEGTQDYWVDSNKSYQNIFSRANSVAKRFRENRGSMINELNEIDRKMSCKCIAIYGPSKFDAAKQAFFDTSCEEEKQLLTTNLDVDVDTDSTTAEDDRVTEEVDRASMDSVADSGTAQTEEQRIEEVDKGAIGISHERLLIEWLGLRRDAQMKRFVDNSELEADLNDLSKFISETDFEEVWKDEVVDSKVLNRHSPPGDTVPLFNWKYTYPPGWLAIVIIIIAVVATFFLGPAAWELWILALGAAIGVIVATVVGAYKDAGQPGVYDIMWVEDKKHSTFKRFDGLTKYYVGPKFNNSSPRPDTLCDIYANASACMKSAYRVQMQGLDYLEHLNGKVHYLVDPKLPLFMAPADLSLDKMPGYNQTWVEIINEMRDEGVPYLRSLGVQAGGRSMTSFDDPCYKSSGKGCYGKIGTSFYERDLMQEAREAKYFFPKKGNFTAKDFDKGLENKVKAAAKQYALCKSFKPGGGSTGTPVLVQNCAIEGMGDDDFGFGELFETETEAENFAKYTLEMHYIYSSLSVEDVMGYPLMGQEAYFAMVAYNMKLVGSLAAARVNKYAEAYALYVADWKKRIGEYQALGEGASGTQGVNLTYSQAFYDVFGRFEFNGLDNVPEIDAFMAQVQANGGEFNQAEITALNAARNKAIRTNQDLEDQKRFLADTKNITGQELRLQNQENAIARANNPLASFGVEKLGGVTGLNKLNKALNKINKNILSLGRRKKSNNNSNAGITPFKIPTYSPIKMPRLGGGSDAGKSAVAKDQGMSYEQASALVDRLKRDEDLNNVTVDDTLFTIVSKAYKRNYSRVLVRNKPVKDALREEPAAQEDSTLSDKKKEELKKLLSQ